MTFSPLGNSDHIVVSVSFDFPSNSQQEPLFHCIAFDYSPAYWDGPRDHLRGLPREDILKLGASAATSEFVSGFRLEFMYISLTENIRSNLTHLHGFHLLVLLP